MPGFLYSKILDSMAIYNKLILVYIVQFAVYAAYRNRLETAFLADELASAIPTVSDCASRPASPKRAAGQGSTFGTPSMSAAGTPKKGSPKDRSNEHLQITQPDGGTALASRSAQLSTAAPPKEEPASTAGAIPARVAWFTVKMAIGCKVLAEASWEFPIV